MSFRSDIADAFKAIEAMPLRVDRIIMSQQDYNDVINWGKFECPICHIFVDDLQLHCTEIGDNEHVILGVHIS